MFYQMIRMGLRFLVPLVAVLLLSAYAFVSITNGFEMDAAHKRVVFYLFLGFGALMSLVTVVIAQVSYRGLLAGVRGVLRGEGIFRAAKGPIDPSLMPLMKDIRTLLRDIEQDRKVRDEAQVTWTPRSLKKILNEDLSGEEVIVVSNREPYVHVRKDDKIEVQFPASGLVTAMEPIMRACSGTWIAHGSGSADKDVVDDRDRVAVPPGKPSYTLRRVWLTEEEEKRYYYGFANEGLWPLCHIAHVRPIFRAEDWEVYEQVNRKFAKAVIAEARTDEPVILIQDYHFALLPKMLREKLPRATIITFWHIPWPNVERFGICPWGEQIVEGLLGSSVVGFHTRYHTNNFIETIDRLLEARIDRENFTISHQGQMSAVRNYPISIEWPPRGLDEVPDSAVCRENILQKFDLPENASIGVGVDRLDYTKGILERFNALDCFFEKFPEWKGKLFFLQVAASSRSAIVGYRDFAEEVAALAQKINFRHSTNGRGPIVLINEHQDTTKVFELLRSANFCFVSSLHDGMNLVAKEFVAARDDLKGVLILSMFTGAARELPEAMIVNPYNQDQCADAIAAALEMTIIEQRERMKSMRALVSEFNVFRWAGRMLLDAAKVRYRNKLRRRTHHLQFLEKTGSVV